MENTKPRNFDLCLLWNWPYDADFVSVLEAMCKSRNLALLQLTPDNLQECYASLQRGELTFSTLLDRACDQDTRFLPVVEWAREHDVYRINCYELARCAWDKAAMHAAIGTRLATPPTIVLPSYAEAPDLPWVDPALLSNKVVAKPVHGGGGKGVVIDICSPRQVADARKGFPEDHYLLQSQIAPTRLGDHSGWFRVLYCTGQTYLCWWDTSTHVYSCVTEAEERDYGLSPLRQVASTIAGICRLQLFSTEVAVTAGRFFVIVDYVNDPVDLRMQTRVAEGVPDAVVLDIARRLADLAAEASRTTFPKV